MPCNVQVAEDSYGNLVHLLAEVRNGRSQEPTVFMQNSNGVQSMTTGRHMLSGNLTHRFTASHYGNKEQYIEAVNRAGYDGQHKKQMLKRAGASNIKKGVGAVIAVASIAAATLTGAQVVHLWTTFMEDGVLTAAEAVRLGLELSEMGNIVSAGKDIWHAAHDGEPGMDLMKAAEHETPMERFVFPDTYGDSSNLDTSTISSDTFTSSSYSSNFDCSGAADTSGGLVSEVVGIAGELFGGLFN